MIVLKSKYDELEKENKELNSKLEKSEDRLKWAQRDLKSVRESIVENETNLVARCAKLEQQANILKDRVKLGEKQYESLEGMYKSFMEAGDKLMSSRYDKSVT